MMDACTVFRSSITATPKRFMNSIVFVRWLEHFEANVPCSEKQPLILVCKGYGSHYND
jgi:hypothetical protein